MVMRFLGDTVYSKNEVGRFRCDILRTFIRPSAVQAQYKYRLYFKSRFLIYIPNVLRMRIDKELMLILYIPNYASTSQINF